MRVATAIEVALHAQCGAVNAEYKGRLRSVCANLRRDSGWRAMVLSGEVSAVQIGAMDAAQMLGAAARAAREAAARRAMAEATVTDGVRVERSTAFTCPSCGANDAEVRTVSSAGKNDCTKNEIWGNKEEDNLGSGKTTLNCLRCKFSWVRQ